MGSSCVGKRVDFCFQHRSEASGPDPGRMAFVATGARENGRCTSTSGWSACVQGPFHFLAAHTRQSRRRCDVRTPRADWCSHVTRDPDQGMCLVRVIIEGGRACHSVNPLFLALLCTRWFFVKLHPGASLLQVGHPRHRGCAYAHLTHHQAGGSSCTAAREIW